jgi:predicted permease
VNGLLSLFADNILPILIVAAVGFALQRTFHLDPAPLSKAAFYAFTPALVFNLLLRTTIDLTQVMQMTAFSACTILVMIIVSWLASRLLRLDRLTTSALILTVAFMNSGNYGLSVNKLALGDQGLAWASLFFIASSICLNSLGVYTAGAGRASWQQALIGLLKVPALYAIPAALLLRSASPILPTAIQAPVDIMAAAAIPTLLIFMGAKIAQAGSLNRWRLLAAAAALRLVISPLLASIAAPLFGIQGIARQAGILEAGMPTAVLASVVAMEFDVHPEFVTGAVLATTLLSPLTLTPLIALLGIR